MLRRWTTTRRSDAALLINPRRQLRYEAVNLGCDLGLIQDMSESGMRIHCLAKPAVELGSIVRLTVSSTTQRLRVEGQIVWIRKSWLRGSQIGVRFVNTPASVSRALVDLARYGFVEVGGPGSFQSSVAGAGAASGTSSASSASQPGHAAASDRTKDAAGRRVSATVDIENYYEALGLKPDCTAKDIHTAFRAMAREYHPDVNKSPDADQRFAFIAKAYGVLKDPAKRQKYDQLREPINIAAA